jgi:hypothetical protein
MAEIYLLKKRGENLFWKSGRYHSINNGYRYTREQVEKWKHEIASDSDFVKIEQNGKLTITR